MEEPSCLGCRALLQRLMAAERRIAELEALVNRNASNSSLPPSANPPQAPKPVVKKKTGRKPGGQPGHPPHLRKLLPPERVNTTHHFVPTQCSHCQTSLPKQAEPHDPEPTRFQTIELPSVVAVVTEYQGHARTCSCCGEVTRATIPAEIRAHRVGPRLMAVLSYFAGCHGISKRAIEEIADQVFDAPIALGTVVNLEQEVSAALADAHQEAQAAVRASAVKNVDETSWKLSGKLRWLWAAATTTVAVFTIHARRGAAGLTALLGEAINGTVISDRWGVYNKLPNDRRQICWAHLKRDFQRIVDRGGTAAWVGRSGLTIVKKVFAAWHEFREGRLTRQQLEENLTPVIRRWGELLVEGAFVEDAPVAAFCENLLELDHAPWTFVSEEGVEPTNNHIERLLRRAVLWRKRSFGSGSEAGCRFVERILTVVQTRRLQGRNVLEYLQEAIQAHWIGLPCPKLLPAG